MFNTKVRKAVCVMAAAFCIMGTVFPVMAETTNFDITISLDDKSPRAKKADSEQKYYATATSMNLDKYWLIAKSVNLNDPKKFSEGSVTLYLNQSKNAKYGNYYAKAGTYHYLERTGGVSGLRVRGRYTP